MISQTIDLMIIMDFNVFRLSNDHLQLAPVERSNGKKDGKRITYDWNDTEIRSISEIIAANQVEYLKS